MSKLDKLSGIGKDIGRNILNSRKLYIAMSVAGVLSMGEDISAQTYDDNSIKYTININDNNIDYDNALNIRNQKIARLVNPNDPDFDPKLYFVEVEKRRFYKNMENPKFGIGDKISSIKNVLNNRFDMNIDKGADGAEILHQALLQLSNEKQMGGLKEFTGMLSGEFDINMINAYGYIQSLFPEICKNIGGEKMPSWMLLKGTLDRIASKLIFGEYTPNEFVKNNNPKEDHKKIGNKSRKSVTIDMQIGGSEDGDPVIEEKNDKNEPVVVQKKGAVTIDMDIGGGEDEDPVTQEDDIQIEPAVITDETSVLQENIIEDKSDIIPENGVVTIDMDIGGDEDENTVVREGNNKDETATSQNGIPPVVKKAEDPKDITSQVIDDIQNKKRNQKDVGETNDIMSDISVPQDVKDAYIKIRMGLIKHNNKSYIIISKTDFQIYMFDKDHKKISNNDTTDKVLLGETKGDHKNIENSVKTTPGGEYRVGLKVDDVKSNRLYKSKYIVLIPREGQYKYSEDYTIGIHALYINEEIKRKKALDSPETTDNNKSYGCPNTSIKTFKKLDQLLIPAEDLGNGKSKLGSLVYITHEPK